MHDPLPRGQMNAMVMEAMHETKPIFWVVTAVLAAIVVFALGYEWYVLIMQGQGMAGVTRPDYWGVFLVNTVFWIGISHAGTFISAILRVLKVNSVVPSPRGRIDDHLWAGPGWLRVFMHLGSSGWCTGCSRFQMSGASGLTFTPP